MKTLILSLIMAAGLTAQANTKLTCDTVNLLDDNIFEESLGETGDPFSDDDSEGASIKITKAEQSIRIGQIGFSSKRLKVTVKNTSTELSVTAVDKTFVVQVKVFKKSGLGIVLHRDIKATKYTPVVEIDCNDYTEVKKDMVNQAVESELIDKKDIPFDVTRKMDVIDVAYEYGDGYYSVESEQYYLLSVNGNIVGYVLESYMSYTEGDDTTVRTYFLTNGVRFAGPIE